MKGRQIVRAPQTRRRAWLLVLCHLLVFVALPLAHGALPGHDRAGAAHDCPLCQNLTRAGEALASDVGAAPVRDAAPAIVAGAPHAAAPRGTSIRLPSSRAPPVA